MARRTRRLLALMAVGTIMLAAQQACVIAQPSGDVPQLPPSRPSIVHPSVVPSTSVVLTRWPTVFIVPVELVDPTKSFFYAKFIDYNPRTGEGLIDRVEENTFQPSNTTDRTRTLELAIAEPTTPGCHVVEVVVALTLNGRDGKNAHTPDEPGGDIVSWFYNPNGDLGGCPTLDAGLDAHADADADADGGGVK